MLFYHALRQKQRIGIQKHAVEYFLEQDQAKPCRSVPY